MDVLYHELIQTQKEYKANKEKHTTQATSAYEACRFVQIMLDRRPSNIPKAIYDICHCAYYTKNTDESDKLFEYADRLQRIEDGIPEVEHEIETEIREAVKLGNIEHAKELIKSLAALIHTPADCDEYVARISREMNVIALRKRAYRSYDLDQMRAELDRILHPTEQERMIQSASPRVERQMIYIRHSACMEVLNALNKNIEIPDAIAVLRGKANNLRQDADYMLRIYPKDRDQIFTDALHDQDIATMIGYYITRLERIHDAATDAEVALREAIAAGEDVRAEQIARLLCAPGRAKEYVERVKAQMLRSKKFGVKV